MSESLSSILCDETWIYDSNIANVILFNKNGTGELSCRAELNVWIATEFDWKPQTSSSLDQLIATQSDTRTDTHIISQFGIEMTLTTRRLEQPQSARYLINEALLTDDAFLPKTYSLRLEKGNFLTPCDELSSFEDEFTPRFALRLAFDKSPYPPREEWKEPEGAPDAVKMWKWKAFVSRSSPELKLLKKHGDNSTPWRDCVVC